MTCHQYIGQSMAILSILIFCWFYNLVQYRTISAALHLLALSSHILSFFAWHDGNLTILLIINLDEVNSASDKVVGKLAHFEKNTLHFVLLCYFCFFFFLRGEPLGIDRYVFIANKFLLIILYDAILYWLKLWYFIFF